jgi:hypothetical protein
MSHACHASVIAAQLPPGETAWLTFDRNSGNMMRRAAVLSLLLSAPFAAAQTERAFPAVLAGHAILPAATFVPPPPGAPPGFAVSGRFTGPQNRRAEQAGSIPGSTGPAPGGRPTGIALPFQGQPVQGFSGIKPAGDGSYWVVTDNGFGNRRNSPDALLMFHRVRPDFAAGTVALERTIFLSDPNRIIPFHIVTDPSPTRFLTGADFDLESIQPVADGFFFGDEFGPYLIRTDAEGRVTGFWETQLDGRVLQSPDHFALQVPPAPNAPVPFQVPRSGGYEGMALSPDGARLYALLERPLLVPATGQPEGAFLRILEFDIPAGRWTGRTLRFALADGATAIGDFNMIDDRRALIIERDNGEGHPSLACAQGQNPPGCFPNPARLKRVVLVDLGDVSADGFVRRIGHIDLMAIADPDRRARTQGDRGEGATGFSFPFFTIEDVAMVDAQHIIVANDNNLPFSAGRHLTRADDNEFILLRVPELLSAR